MNNWTLWDFFVFSIVFGITGAVTSRTVGALTRRWRNRR